jgi:hypothetical protein
LKPMLGVRGILVGAVLACLVAGCGGGGGIEAPVPKEAYSAPPPPLSDAHKAMKEQLAKQTAPPGAAGGGLSEAHKKMKAKLQQQKK